MLSADLRVTRSSGRCGELAIRIGVPLADMYLEFLGGRCQQAGAPEGSGHTM